MITRRSALGVIASASTLALPGLALAKEKQHLDGVSLLGQKLKKNGKHKLHTAGKNHVFAEVRNGKIVGVSAAGMDVKKVRSTKKLADVGDPFLTLASTKLAQIEVYYYGYWVYDPFGDYYYWFTSDVVVVDSTWIDIVI